ncbi:uncharacterized protein LOC130447503 [Diorhabda sublineata]|nr:uncharacterized protein LOC130447503 [Diorhabda sublineata]
MLASVVLLTFCFFTTFASQGDYVQWITYTGEIPNNAVPGGSDAKNNPEFIGRAFYATDSFTDGWTENSTEGYFPGVLQNGAESIEVIVYREPHTITEGIEILVANEETHLEWKEVMSFEFPKLFDDPRYHPVIVGNEFHGFLYNSTVYLGRVNHQGSDVFGKILNIANAGENKILYYAFQGEFHTAEKYDVLVYYF